MEQVEELVELGDVDRGLGILFDGLLEARETMSGPEWSAFARYLRDEHTLRHMIYQAR